MALKMNTSNQIDPGRYHAMEGGLKFDFESKAIPSHSTATTDASWDGPANEARLKDDQLAAYYRKEYAWQDDAGDGTKKGDFRFPHHTVSTAGDIGAANTKACMSIIASLNGARSKPKIPSGDRQGVYNHAKKHLTDAGVDAAPLKDWVDLEAELKANGIHLDDSEDCECTCESCVAGNCSNCTNTECDDPNCDCDQNDMEQVAAVLQRNQGRFMNSIPASASKTPANFRSAVGSDGCLEMFVYDDIGESWWSDGITAKGIKYQVENAAPHTSIRLRINSFGGDSFEGVTIGNYLRSTGKQIECCVDGLAASAASVIAMCGHSIKMAGNSMMMIHNASTMAYGYASDLRKVADVLDTVSTAVAQTYVDRTGNSAARIKEMLDAETWMDAATCVQEGFATSVVEPDPDQEQRSQQAIEMLRKTAAIRQFKNLPKQFASKPSSRVWLDDVQAGSPQMNLRILAEMEIMNFGRGANVDMTAAERQFSLEESRQMGFDKPVILAVRRRAAATARVESHVKQFPPKNGFQASLETKKIVMTLVPYDGSLCFLGGSTYETYQKNCFKDGLENDPRCTFNHDERYILGRASAGTARFTEDAAGVHAEIDPPDTTWASDLMVSMARNDVDGSSAAFWLVDYKMEQRGDKKVRVVTQAILREGAVLAWQAYKNATAAIEDPQSQPAASAASATTTMANRLKLLALR